MKLALGVVSACISAMLANFFVRFGLFSLGAATAGGTAYLVLDAFPFLDPTREDWIASAIPNNGTTTSIAYTALLHPHDSPQDQQSSGLSAFGWIVTVLVGIWGGIFLRWYEQASLQVVTAIMGGLGFAYSFHTFVILQGGQLHRSVVFLLANFVAFFGWRFQRRRLLEATYEHKKNYDETTTTHSYSPVSQ